MSVAAVILAGGKGRRFQGKGPKLRTTFRGKPLITWSVNAAIDAQLDEVVVVCGAVDLLDLLPDSVTVLQNENWSDGIATSLRVAIDWAERQGHEAIVVALGDTPLIEAEAFRLVSRADETPISVASYSGKRGHPVRLSTEIWPILPISGDEGARSIMFRDDGSVTVVNCLGESADLDTQEDLRRWS